MNFEKVITGGTVVMPGGTLSADIGIANGVIEAIGSDLLGDSGGALEISAAGHFVLPGVLDVNVNVSSGAFPAASVDDFESASRAAALGGVTTLFDTAMPETVESLTEALDRCVAAAKPSLVDYAFHIGITAWEDQKDEIDRLIDRGFPTFKAFMSADESSWISDDRVIFSALEKMHERNAMLLVHAASDSVIRELVRRNRDPERMARTGARLHAETRPGFVEAEAVQRAALWSEVTQGQLYLLHVSTARAADFVKAAQLRGVPVVAETCPQYLVLDESIYDQADGHLYATIPPIRPQSDALRLWKSMRSGEVSVVSSDSFSVSREQKAVWAGDYSRIPPGLPGLETLLPVLYTHGVRFGRISIEELSRLLSTNPAQIMGVYPRKGAIQVGADADLTIIHPTREIIFESNGTASKSGWSPYDSWSLAGFARTTLVRGELVVEGYKIVSEGGTGRLLRRDSAGLFTRIPSGSDS